MAVRTWNDMLLPLLAGGLAVQLPTRFGEYELLERIAAGGMAEVFRAVSRGAEGFEKELCIKKILPMFSEDHDFVAMFIDEAALASKLHHANIVQIFDFDKIGEQYYIAMELVEGKDLKRVMNALRKSGRSFPVDLGAFVTAELLKGLHYAHTRQQAGVSLGVIHRDISPHNVLVSLSGEVKITDFGIAKAASRASATRSGVVKGKIVYMSPEQAMGASIDQRSDLFAAGVVVYELLTGVRPFLGDTDSETLAKIQRGTFEPPRTLRPEIPARLDAVLCKLMARDPDQRFRFGSEALRELAGDVPADGAMQLGELMQGLAGATVAPAPRQATQVLPGTRPPAFDPPVIPADSAAVTRTRGPREEPEALAFLDTRVASPAARAPSPGPSVDPTAPGGAGTAAATTAPIAGPATLVSGPPRMAHSEPIVTTPDAIPAAWSVPDTRSVAVAPRRRTRRVVISLMTVALAMVAVGLVGFSMMHAPVGPSLAPPAGALAGPGGPAALPAPTAPPVPAISPVTLAAEPAASSAPVGAQAPTGASTPVRVAPRKGAGPEALDGPTSDRHRAPQTEAGGSSGTPGSVIINAQPWARVQINGRSVGTTPVGPIDVPAGVVRIHLERDGRQPITRSERVGPGQRRSLFYELP